MKKIFWEGNTRSPLDMQIAATAFKFGMTLVTRNIRDMQGVGVLLLFDGHDDMLLSEPMANFGTGGGCWTAYRWTNGLYQAVGSFGAHYAAWSFDKDTGDSGGLRFWYYWHSSCREGTLGYYIISAKGVKDDKSQRFSITMDSGDQDCGRDLATDGEFVI